MNKKIRYIIFILLLNLNIFAQENICQTKYPIVLVHGISYKNNIFVKKYWGNIPNVIRKNGAIVYVSNVDAFGTIENNAGQLQREILKIIDETGCEKVNLIAHSKGGLDSRYMISKLNMANYVASLTTISTPHRGSQWADVGLKWAKKNKMEKPADFICYIFAKIILDENPQPFEAYYQFRTDNMEQLNKTLPNATGVYYQSYGSYVNDSFPSLPIRFKNKIITKEVGLNDGIVPAYSYKWGEFQGYVGQEIAGGVSHFEIIGFSNLTNFNHIQFFITLVHNLKTKGF